MLNVLITRPEHQSLGLLNRVRAAGWQGRCIPALAIDPIALDPVEKQKVLDLDRYDAVVCVSANAAELGMEWVSQYWPQMPVAQHWFAVGPATAEVLASWHVTAQYPAQRDDSEGLLALAGLQTLDQQRVLILRGRSGRELLAKTLLSRGATVDYLELYERSLPTQNAPLLQDWLRGSCPVGPGSVASPSSGGAEPADGQRVVTVSSGDGLKHLVDLAGHQVSQLLTLPVVVVSERLARYARDQGFSTVWVAKGAADDAVVSCIKEHIDGSQYD